MSWWSPLPEVSLRFLEACGVGPAARILDVGCGQAGLAGHLVARGFSRVAALDVSPVAAARAKARLGERADAVTWLVGDVRDHAPSAPYDLWHDRAVLHFLVEPADRARYADAVARGVAPGGHVVLATFAPDGPETCSGLPVARHDAAGLARLLGDRFRLLAAEREAHGTPWGTTQAFTWALFARHR